MAEEIMIVLGNRQNNNIDKTTCEVKEMCNWLYITRFNFFNLFSQAYLNFNN